MTAPARGGSLPEAVAAGAGWRPLLLLGALGGGVLAQGTTLLMAPEVATGLGRSVETTGALLGLWVAGVVLGAPFALRLCLLGRLVAAASRGGALVGLSFALLALASSPAGVAVAAVVGGAGAVLATAPARSLLAALYPPLALVHVLLAARAVALATGALALVVAVPLVDATDLGWRGGLLLLAAVAGATGVLAARLTEPAAGAFELDDVRRRLGGATGDSQPGPVTGFAATVRRLLAVPSVKPLLGCLAATTALGYGVVLFGGYALAQRSGLGTVPVAWSVVLAAAVGVVVALDQAGRASGDWRQSPARLATTGVRALLVAGVATALTGLADRPVLAVPALAAAAGGLAVAAGAVDRLLVVVVPPALRGAVGAVCAVVAGAVGVGLGGSVLAAVESSAGTPWALGGLGLLGAAGALALRAAGRTAGQDAAAVDTDVVEAVETAQARARGVRAPLLSCRRIRFSYGPLQILFDVDFQVDDGEMVALLGTNGAGKSTLLRVISGLGLPSAGTVRIAGQDVTYAEPGERVRLGVSQIPGGKAVFGPLSVVDNLRLYGYALGRDKRAVDRGIEESFATFPRLAERRNSPASTMSGGEQQMLALSKALILKPRLLLIDELSLGLAPKVVGELLTLVRSINASGTSVVLVEQSVNVALSLAEHAYFMEKGAVRFDGRTADLLERPDVLRSVFLAGAASQEGGSVIDLLGLEVPYAILVSGIASGIAYGLLGVGLVLVYRSSRFINFAHSQIGAFGAAVMAILVIEGSVPYWVALPLGMLVSAAVASGVEVTVVRRLARAPRLMSMVATLGVGQFLFFMSLVLNAQATSSSFFPLPSGLPTITLNGLELGREVTGLLLLGPLAVLLLSVFFRRSRYGLAIRGAAANPDAAAMAGMSPQRLTNLSWAITGGLACLTAALLIPSLGALAGAALGPTLLLRALVAAVIGRMQGLVATFVAGVAIGVLDRVVTYRLPDQVGLADVVLLGVVLLSLLLQSKPGRREEEKGAWLAVKPWPALPEELRALWLLRRGGLALGVVALAAAAALPSLLTSSDASVMAQLLALVVVGLSLSVLTGLGGQLSLGQFAIAGAGAVGSVAVAQDTGSLALGLVVGTAVGAAVSVLIGIPALRVRGLLFAVATLAFALAMRGYLLKQDAPLGFGNSTVTTDTTVLGVPIDDGRAQAYLALAVLGLALLVVRNLHASSFGRLLVALRDNEDAARAFSVRAPARKLQAYAVAGALAGIGGSLFAATQTVVSAGTFPADTSIVVTVMVVVGGAGLVAGPLLGAFLAYPTLVNTSPAVSGSITLAWLVLILYYPNGIAGLLRPLREAVVSLAARLGGVDAGAARAGADPSRAADTTPTGGSISVLPRQPAPVSDEPLLVATGLVKQYGGLRAVGGVDLEIRRGECLGLIGPNGAGKTTLFECLSGFVKVDEGTISFDGRDITRWSPERRAHSGLIRSFQDSALFATMTVLETVMVAGERSLPTRLTSSVVGSARTDRRREERARELLALFGLDRYRHTEVGSLSTGTRRIAELACMVSLEPTLMLLDEPSSGVAQAEVEALGTVLADVQRHLGATMVVIEHDIALVSALSDRLVAMETGTVLAVGTPRAVLDDPRVVESYLGGDPTAVHRTTQPTRRELLASPDRGA